MTITHPWIHDLTQMHPGDQIEVRNEHHLRHVGTVSQVAPHLGVLWVREANSGPPKLIPAQDYRLRHSLVAQAA